VVITRTEQVQDLTAIKEAIQQFAGKAPIFSSRMLTSRIRRVDSASGDDQGPLGQPVGAFCGVGNPESFFEHLRSEGHQLAFTRTFADHHHYKQPELDALVENAVARGARSLITTEKDAIKLASVNFGIPCYVLEIQILIEEEKRLVEIIRDAIFNVASGN
jgi:tetraacyldisaccharide 4'-kinase